MCYQITMKNLIFQSVVVCLVFCSTTQAFDLQKTHKKIPRFATLRSNEANLRCGPGTYYPYDWVYVKSGLPIEITAEYETWRRIRDCEGTEGWVHQAMLSGQRHVIVTSVQANVYNKPEQNHKDIVASVDKNVIGRVLKCKIDMCLIKWTQLEGWIHRQDIWGVQSDEMKFK